MLRFAVLVLATTTFAVSAAFAQSAGAIPSTVSACWTDGSVSKDFCTAIQNNNTDAVSIHYAPNLNIGVASFGPRWLPNDMAKPKKPRLLRRAAAQDPKSLLNFPGWQSAKKGTIISTGRYTYAATSTIVDDATTQYDMASCSKIMATTTATAQLYQMGLLDLDEKIASPKLLGPAFASKGKGDMTVRNLLLHNSGFPPDPTPYWYSSPQFNCKNNLRYHPVQDFDCVENVFNDLVYNQELQYPTGSQYLYSDLSMITLMFVIDRVVAAHNLVPKENYPPVCVGPMASTRTCNFYAWVHNNIFKRYGMDGTLYIPDDALRTAPFWYSDSYRHMQVAGFVSDENAYALGGISGHAGVFSTVNDVMKFLAIWADLQDPAMLNETTVSLFATAPNLTQSARALGWSTNRAGTYDQPTPPCGTLSPQTILHEGYTGQMICIDPVTGTATALLSGARYPSKKVDKMITYRPVFNTLVNSLLFPK